jgi:hypothetical protein
MPENALSDGFVHVAQLIWGAIVDNEFVVQLFKAKLIAHSVSLLRPLQSVREGVVNLRLHFQKLA